ncbi:Rpn family recombination-promoting nuclease/putative transposase [Anaerolineales bacterium HSG6]|nr:Rpn family recombination-promoting nuclease/putative transposase [Anaerolineales bacterium HSG6]
MVGVFVLSNILSYGPTIACSFIQLYNQPMTDTLTNPHDKLFRDTFYELRAARDFLHHYLPSELSTLLNLDTLEISKDSFIDPALQEHFSDVLYHVSLTNGEPLDVYILFEHKSYPDKWVARQLLRYMDKIWTQQEQQEKPLTYLRPVLPLVIYHGQRGWTIDRQFQGLFSPDLPSALRPYLPDFRYWLLDLSDYPDEKITGWVILQARLLLLKYVWAKDFGVQFERIVRLLFELPNQETALQHLETLLRYAVSTAEHASEEDLHTIIIDLFEKEGDEIMPTIAERWVKQGEEIGFAKGQQKIREAEQKAKQNEQKARQNEQRARQNEQRAWDLAFKHIRQTLVIRFDTTLDQYDKRLKKLKLSAMEYLSDRTFELPTLAEFEAALTKLETPPPDEETSTSDETNATKKM